MASPEPTSGHHIVPVKIYVVIFLALACLTVLTTAVAFVDLGPFNNVVMLAISLLKTSLVVLFFMHVKYSTRLVPLIAVGAVVWLLIMFGITMSDYMTRGWLGAGSSWPRP
jgi:cytochrome c oxidase subunit 4